MYLDTVRNLCKQIDALRVALTIMLDEKIDYMRINHLGDPEKQRSVIVARQALALIGVKVPSTTTSHAIDQLEVSRAAELLKTDQVKKFHSIEEFMADLNKEGDN